MNEQEKPFGTASIVLLLLVAGISDIADLATDLIFLVPVIGQIVFLFNSFVISPIVWAIIQFSFIMKTGAGRASIIAVLGGFGNIANIPGSETITTVIAIMIANNPKASRIASIVSKTSAAKGLAGDVGETEGAIAGTKRTEVARTESGMEEGALAEESKEGIGRREISPRELGEEPEPMEKLQEKLFNETPPQKTDEENGNIYEDGNEIDLRKK